MKPIGNRVLVESAEKEKTTSSGIIIPDSVNESNKPKLGKVVAIGSKMEEDISIGDTIVYGKYAGFEIELEGKKHMILLAEDVLGVI